FKGKQARGYIWEICTNLPGHELLSSITAQAANPRSRFGQQNDAQPAGPSSTSRESSEAAQPELPGFGCEETPNDAISEAPPIPDWAADSETPEDQRPRAEFLDLGSSGSSDTEL